MGDRPVALPQHKRAVLGQTSHLARYAINLDMGAQMGGICKPRGACWLEPVLEQAEQARPKGDVQEADECSGGQASSAWKIGETFGWPIWPIWRHLDIDPEARRHPEPPVQKASLDKDARKLGCARQDVVWPFQPQARDINPGYPRRVDDSQPRTK